MNETSSEDYNFFKWSDICQTVSVVGRIFSNHGLTYTCKMNGSANYCLNSLLRVYHSPTPIIRTGRDQAKMFR